MYQISEHDIAFCDRYVRKLCGRCGRPADDDAIQSGREGMVIASHKFDPEQNDNFQGYATWQIKHELYRNHFGFKKKRNFLENSLVYHDSFCYIHNSGESRIVNQMDIEKILNNLTDDQRFVAIQMGVLGKTGGEMEAEFGDKYQTYDYRFRCIRRKIRKRYGKEINHG